MHMNEAFREHGNRWGVNKNDAGAIEEAFFFSFVFRPWVLALVFCIFVSVFVSIVSVLCVRLCL
jgi:hypothetical protein